MGGDIVKNKKDRELKNMASMTVPINQAFVVSKDKVKEFKKHTVSKDNIEFILKQAKKFENQRKKK